jgi:Tfp pilus assembly protein PilX
MVSPTQDRRGERGAALVLALFMIVVLTVLGLGLVLRTKVTMSVAGAERPITKNFYAAEGGINAAFARLQTRNPCAFNFGMYDSPGEAGRGAVNPIQVNVAESRLVGFRRVVGTEAGGGVAGGGTTYLQEVWRLNSDTQEAATHTRRAIEVEVTLDPTPASIPGVCAGS